MIVTLLTCNPIILLQILYVPWRYGTGFTPGSPVRMMVSRRAFRFDCRLWALILLKPYNKSKNIYF